MNAIDRVRAAASWTRRCLIALLVLLAAAHLPTAFAQDCGDLLDSTQVLDFHVTMDPGDWEALRLSCPGGLCAPPPHSYYNAMFRCEDGAEIQVGIRRKNGKAEPRDDDPQKPGLKIDINEFVPGQTFAGKVKINLENGGGSAGPNPEGSNDNGVREGFAWLLYGDTGVVASRVAWVNVYVNGDLKGLYTHVEQVDKAYLIDHGIDEGGWLFKGPGNIQRTREGEPNPYAFNWYPFDHANPADPQPPDWHEQTEYRVDMSQLFTLAAVTNFVGNKDAVVFKNNNYWYYDWSIFPDGQQPRLYLGWDLDTTMKPDDVDEPILGTPHNNGHMAQALLRDDPVFQAQYYLVYGDLISGPLSETTVLARLASVEALLTPHIDADPFQTAGTAVEQFQGVRDFLQARSAFVTAALGACPNTVCDVAETPCTCPADCGAPPVAETNCADLIDEDCDQTIDCADSDCLLDPVCEELPAPNLVVVNEIVADSPGSPDVEYVEILNTGPGAQDLTGWYLLDDDNQHDPCLLDATLEPGEYLVVAGLIAEFSARYPDSIAALNPNEFDSTVPGEGFSLGDGEDQIRLFRPTGGPDEFVHGYAFGPQSNEIPFGYLPQGSDAPEYITFPTPGLTNELAQAFSPICINEFLTTSQSGGVDDWVELFNRGSVPIDISGWYLSDNPSVPMKYAFPPGTSIPPGGFLKIDETELGFAFSSTGSEAIVLTHSDGDTGQDFFDYGPQFPDVTQGRYPDGTPEWLFFSAPSAGLPNACRVTNLVFESSTGYRWSPVIEAGTYDVVRGDLGLLRSTSGDFSVAVTGCEGDDLAGTDSSDETIPAPGEGFLYLVRVVDSSCGSGTYDSASPSQSGSRDAAIAGSASACP